MVVCSLTAFHRGQAEDTIHIMSSKVMSHLNATMTFGSTTSQTAPMALLPLPQHRPTPPKLSVGGAFEKEATAKFKQRTLERNASIVSNMFSGFFGAPRRSPVAFDDADAAGSIVGADSSGAAGSTKTAMGRRKVAAAKVPPTSTE